MIKHQPRKRFGQNFLHDQTIIQQIIRTIAAKPDDHIVEIGPGLGALTQYLVEQIEKFSAIEIDQDLAAQLNKQFPQLTIHQTNALTFDFKQLVVNKPLRIVGNLPYNISTPLIFHVLNFIDNIQDIYFMLQKEVVDRIVAPANSKHYGRLSVMVQYHCQAIKLLSISARAFKPQPKVQSALIHLIPYRTPPHIANDYQQFAQLVNLTFSQRRKKLSTSLKTLLPITTLNHLSIDLNRRPETLTVAEFVYLSNQTL